MAEMSRPLIQRYRPRSFRERGLAAPFTSPLLCGARLRRMSIQSACGSERPALVGSPEKPSQKPTEKPFDRHHSSALELIVPNPSGGKGVYILPWGDVGAIWRPTMHDVELGRIIASMVNEHDAALTPAIMRTASQVVAASGLAGRAAAHAAERAALAQADGLVATRFTLLMQVTEQIEARGAQNPVPLQAASSLEIQQRGGHALLQLATNLGQPAHLVDATLDTLARYFVEIGLGMSQHGAALARLASKMEALQHELIGWAQTEALIGNHETSSSCRDAQAVAMAAELAGRMAQSLLEASRARVLNIQALIQATLAGHGEIEALCDRPALLLDGWAPICHIWLASAGEPSRHAALQRIIRQIPLLPDEVEDWLGLPAGTADQLFQHHISQPLPPRREHGGLIAVARNEQLRAMAA